jgi:hypothetical protein
MGHIDAPRIKHLVMIDPHRLEVYWDQEVQHEELGSAYRINKLQKTLAIDTDRSIADSDWATRPIYEPIKKRTTLYLLTPLTRQEMNQVSVSVVGNITNSEGTAAEKKSYHLRHWQEFYTRFTQTKSGILIKSSDDVSREAHRKAQLVIDEMLVKIPQVAEKMVAENVELAIYGRHQDAYDIPEHRGGSDVLGRPAEGFGGCVGNPTTSISEVNVLRITDGPSQTRYTNECILAHEFGHAIHLVGINLLADQSLADELRDCYQHAKDQGLWPETYIISNYEEYFATLTTIWFNVMAESSSGTWDGVRGPLNRREELQAYDPKGYAFFAKIYPETALPYPWNETPKKFPEMMSKIKDGTIHQLEPVPAG